MNTYPYKTVFSDVDGTLIGVGEKLSESTKNGILSLIEHGILFVPVTARGPSALRYVSDVFAKLPAVCYSGALVIGGDGKVIKSVLIPSDTITLLTDIFRHKYPDVSVNYYLFDSWFTDNAADERVIRESGYVGIVPEPTHGESFLQTGNAFHKLMCIAEKETAEQLERELPALFPVIRAARSCATMLEITAKIADKAYGMKTMSDAFGFNCSEAVAFGDGINDIDMLRYAGLGVAVGNAHEKVKLCADAVAKSAKENGVMDFLKSIKMPV